jgi:hypothetical protein
LLAMTETLQQYDIGELRRLAEFVRGLAKPPQNAGKTV